MQYPVTVSGVKARLVGLGPWFQGAESFPAPYAYGPAKIRETIAAKVREFERMALFQITPCQVSTPFGSLNDNAFPASAQFPLIREDPYDLMTKDLAYLQFRLRRKPVIEVQRMALWVGNQRVMDFPPSWFGLRPREGNIYLLPTQGAALVAATYQALILVGQQRASYLPNALHVDYKAGMASGSWADPFGNRGGTYGTITVSSFEPLNVIGTGTNFLSLPVGTYLYTSGGEYIGQVQCATSNTQLSLEWPVDRNYNNIEFQVQLPGVNPEWADLVRALEEWCAIGVLNDIAQLADAGIDGVQLHGYVSGQTFNYTRFGDRKQELLQSVSSFTDTFRDQETPFLVGFLGG